MPKKSIIKLPSSSSSGNNINSYSEAEKWINKGEEKSTRMFTMSMDTELYKKLKKASFDTDICMSDIVREAINSYLRR